MMLREKRVESDRVVITTEGITGKVESAMESWYMTGGGVVQCRSFGGVTDVVGGISCCAGYGMKGNERKL